MRLSPVQEELLGLMKMGVRPRLRPGPAALVTLPGEHDGHWRDLHGGKPVQANTVQALVNRGLVRREIVLVDGRRTFVYVLISGSHRLASG